MMTLNPRAGMADHVRRGLPTIPQQRDSRRTRAVVQCQPGLEWGPLPVQCLRCSDQGPREPGWGRVPTVCAYPQVHSRAA